MSIGLQDWQQRVVDERKELSERETKLWTFLHSDQFQKLDSTDAKLLLAQHGVMTGLIAILDARIQRFKEEN